MMQIDDLAKLNSDAKQLDGSDLLALTHDVENKTVSLRFKHWDGRPILVECNGVIHCGVSADGLFGNSEVIGAHLECIENGLLDFLERDGYLWKLEPESVKTLQGRWFHLSINGDTCAAVICKEVAFK
jgi:hypothetical protein